MWCSGCSHSLARGWPLVLTIPGQNYAGADGKAAQAIILATLEFARPFHISNLNPLEGMGSQMMPMNVWVNPAYWPFAFLDRQVAAQLSGLIAFVCYALACYAMARCFDVPRLPSVVAAQLSLTLFGPAPSGARICGRLRLHSGLGCGLCAPHAGLWLACAAFARAAAGLSDRGRAVRAPLLQPLLRPVMESGERDCLDRAVRCRDVQPTAARYDPHPLRGTRRPGPPCSFSAAPSNTPTRCRSIQRACNSPISYGARRMPYSRRPPSRPSTRNISTTRVCLAGRSAWGCCAGGRERSSSPPASAASHCWHMPRRF